MLKDCIPVNKTEKDLNKKRVIIVGGGAAGMMAAGQAALGGAEVLLFEKMNQLGRKLGISGKGRCNITNTAPVADFIEEFYPSGLFLRQAFSRFFSDDLISFFEEFGLPTVSERGGRVFPASGKATDVKNVLIRFIEKAGVKINLNSPVKGLIIKNNEAVGVKVLEPTSSITGKTKNESGKETKYFSDAIIITTGGLSYPATGSTGDGYKFAKSAGHKINQTRPALVPLEISGNIVSKLAGLHLRNVRVKILTNDIKLKDTFGEMEFTNFGISGPIVLTLSRYVVDALNLKQKTSLSIDLKPALDEQKLDKRLIRDLEQFGRQQISKILKNLLPQQLIPVCLDETKISPKKAGHQITADERKRLKLWLKDFRLDVTGYRPFSEAIITAGGVSTKEINPRTMESRLIKNLYFAGEILDVDGNTGGYNLQAAFSTGWLAGRCAAKYF
ncbi:NAD(P)/FAD-dependent oxidoreductase [candidate division KSB1 bacterium]|nr:NAD(P)/FAD-dependent oxidoreductase [candidate division KSB1 bacterium]MBL7094452.1 NAD(P)/FAD-dependent oxidoreductase [candidate division KSB1 bacterium]